MPYNLYLTKWYKAYINCNTARGKRGVSRKDRGLWENHSDSRRRRGSKIRNGIETWPSFHWGSQRLYIHGAVAISSAVLSARVIVECFLSELDNREKSLWGESVRRSRVNFCPRWRSRVIFCPRWRAHQLPGAWSRLARCMLRGLGSLVAYCVVSARSLHVAWWRLARCEA